MIEQQQDEWGGDQHRLAEESEGQKEHHPHQAAAGVTRPAGIGAQSEHEEEPAEHILALSDPGHTFDTEGMKGKKCRHERATPKEAGHVAQHQKQQHARGGMQQHVGQVMPARPKSEELAVQHVGKRGERHPNAHLGVRKGPDDAVGRESPAHDGILGDDANVVEIDELKPDAPAKDQYHREEQADAQAFHREARSARNPAAMDREFPASVRLPFRPVLSGFAAHRRELRVFS